ncbi:hypothetical protein K3495_g10882 [Podosphaera aphanis]|nr:hypothetical protein K3495_g10882 [Podosphaera aphanis]
MHYIRILRPPRLTAGSGDRSTKNLSPRLTTKITIATDLGDAFFYQNIQLTVTVLATIPSQAGARVQTYLWKGAEGMRALEVQIPVPYDPKARVKPRAQVWIRPTERDLSVESFADVLRGRPGVLPVGSAWIDIEASPGAEKSVDLMERVLVTRDGQKVHIWEEMGESIARHVWDAGLVLSAWIAQTLCPKAGVAPPLAPIQAGSTSLPFFTRFLHAINTDDFPSICRPLRILELGAGCGMVSLTLLACLSSTTSAICATLTDLPAATEILTTNIASFIPKHPQAFSNVPLITNTVLDWSAPLPPNISATAWHVVLVADCTYNPDVVPDLVATLGRLRDGSRTRQEKPHTPQNVLPDQGMMVILALKERHETERVFFSLMASQGWIVLEHGQVSLPMATSPAEEIRVFVFVSGCQTTQSSAS